MESLMHLILSNALVATGLALAPVFFYRFGRSPALVHGLWLMVLLKLVTPPIVTLPVVIFPATPQVQSPGAMVVSSRLTLVTRPDRQELPTNLVQDDRGSNAWDGIDQNMEPAVPAGGTEPGETGGDLRIADAAYETERPHEQNSHAETDLSSITLPNLPRWEVLALAIVLAGGLVCWSLAAVRIIRLKRLLRDVQPAPADLQARVSAVARQLQLRRVPTTWLVPGRIPPMLWTLGGRARLLVPCELWPDLAESQQTALIAHELAHLKRKDHWVRWLDLAVAGLYWWHPVFWWARRGLREAEEQCCDAWAVWATPRGSRTYAAALLAALEFVSGAPTAGVAAAAAVISGRRHVSCLKRRMRMIVQARTPKALSWAGRLGVLGLATLILPLAPTWAQKPDSPKPDSDRDSATVGVKPDRDIHANFELEMNADGLLEKLRAVRPNNEQLRDQVAQAFRHDPEVGSLIDQIKATTEEMAHTKGVVRKGTDPARIAAQRRLAKLKEQYNDLWSTKSEAIRQQLLKGEAEDEDDDRDGPDRHKDVADHLERLLKDLGEKLSKDLGPVGDEVLKALDTAAKEVTESLDKEGVTSKDLRQALEKARDTMHEAFKEGGPVNKQARDAAEKAREHANEALEKARQEFRQTVRDRAEKAKEAGEGLLSQSKEKDEPPAGDAEQARKEVRQMEQQLRQAMRRLEALERRDQRQSRNQRRGPGAPPPQPPAPPHPPAPPEGPDARPERSARPEAPAPPAELRPLRRPDGPPGMRGPGMTGPGGPPVLNPRVERRLRDLEDKMDRLLKELENLKGEKQDKDKGTGR
jgi:beta-lactamase regulating signal transducer with metallopeptidase domain